ncbi:MAG: oxidoreductase [Candidatus Wallbacteria bacterium HGW-Wallbacteria-1]|uniref:Oxidoreductase n=1 Tax=Candidatus Wallbacteria bacterium HGW-Wallbacteria-1 TaxID=2013854 RepID=A0A2N1PMI5_9BACT|nr:MAG: oxidoreductase [Candidatus Wallbacteria bacterium HGW-Wallbacteria-1]
MRGAESIIRCAESTSRSLFITGTSKGIGRALALHYLNMNMEVAGFARSESSIEHENYRHFRADVSVEAEVISAVRDALDLMPSPWALINNAGVARMNHLLLTTGSSFKSIVDLNLCGTFLFSREVARAMVRSRKGRIINMSTIAAPLTLAGEGAYVASKAGVEALTRTMARELAPHGITVNCLGPCPVETDMIRGIPDDKMKELLARQAIPAFATVDDVAAAVDFYMSPTSSMITGQTLYLGGVW